MSFSSVDYKFLNKRYGALHEWILCGPIDVGATLVEGPNYKRNQIVKLQSTISYVSPCKFINPNVVVRNKLSDFDWKWVRSPRAMHARETWMHGEILSHHVWFSMGWTYKYTIHNFMAQSYECLNVEIAWEAVCFPMWWQHMLLNLIKTLTIFFIKLEYE